MKSASIALATLAVASGVKIEEAREPLLTWAPTVRGSGHPINYFVPHFGEDWDIRTTKKNIDDAEKKYGHILDTSPPPKDPPRDYFVPHFGYDQDIVDSVKNLHSQEAKYGNWNLQMAQLEKKPEEHEHL